MIGFMGLLLFSHTCTYTLIHYISHLKHFRFVRTTFFLPSAISLFFSAPFFLPLFFVFLPLPSLFFLLFSASHKISLSLSLFCFHPILHLLPLSLSFFPCLSLSLFFSRTSKGCVSTKAQLNSGAVDLGCSLTTQEKGRESDRQKEKETRKGRKRRREKGITYVQEY